MLDDKRSAKDLNDVGVDAVALVDYVDFIFRNAETLSVPELLNVALQLRGKNDAKVNDLVQLRKFLQLELQRLERSIDNLYTHSRAGQAEMVQDVMEAWPEATLPLKQQERDVLPPMVFCFLCVFPVF